MCNLFITFEEMGESVLAGALIVSISSKPTACFVFLISAKAICQSCFPGKIHKERKKANAVCSDNKDVLHLVA